MSGRPNPTIETELGIERQCRGCGEFWPTDDGSGRDETFWFYARDRTGLLRIAGRCKACVSERVVDGTSRKYRPMAVTT